MINRKLGIMIFNEELTEVRR